jgi:polyhydroxyalkanoate synthesis regulator phasin
MSESTKLLKKAVLASVGATSSVERIKSALDEAMEDLLKVGQELLGDLEQQGKVKADSVQTTLKNLQEEAEKHKCKIEKNVHASVKKAACELGLVTRADYNELLERLETLEGHAGVEHEDGEVKKVRAISRKKSHS